MVVQNIVVYLYCNQNVIIMSQNTIKIFLAVSMFVAYASIVFLLKLAFSYNQTDANCDATLFTLLVVMLVSTLVSGNLLNRVEC